MSELNRPMQASSTIGMGSPKMEYRPDQNTDCAAGKAKSFEPKPLSIEEKIEILQQNVKSLEASIQSIYESLNQSHRQAHTHRRLFEVHTHSQTGACSVPAEHAF